MTKLQRNTVRWKMEQAALRTKRELSRGIRSLAFISSAAPSIGGIGTAIGIVHSFRGGSGSKMSMFLAIVESLSEAIVPMALGLGVAIPAWLLHRWLSQTLDEFSLEMAIACADPLRWNQAALGTLTGDNSPV